MPAPLHFTSFFQDGDLATPQVIALTPTKYPYGYLGDTSARVYEKTYAARTEWRAFTPRLNQRTSYTNYLTQSDNFGHADWTKTNITVTSDNIATPWDGSVASDKLLETAANAEHYVRQNYVFTASAAQVVWAIVKDINRGAVRIRFNEGSGTVYGATFSLASGVVLATSGGLTTSMTSLGNGWWLLAVFMPSSFALGGAGYVDIVTADGTTTSFAGDTAKGLYVAQAQLERATAVGALIITTTAAVTVSAPDIDTNDPFAYLVDETDPVSVRTDDFATFRRVFARIPAAQTIPASVAWTKPVFPSTSFNSYYISTIDPATTARIYDLLKTLSAEAWKVTAGTYTLTLNGTPTGAINWNANAAAIKAAIEAAIGGTATVNVDVANQSVTFSHTSSIATLAINTGSLTPIAGGAVISSTSAGGFGSSTYSYRSSINQFTSAAHGLTVGATCLPFTGAVAAAADVTLVTVADANTLTFAVAGIVASNGASGYDGLRKFIRTYLPGATRLPARKIERNYIVGLGGVSVATDIPIATISASDNAFLLALCQGTTWLTTDFTGPDYSRGVMLRTVETQVLVQ